MMAFRPLKFSVLGTCLYNAFFRRIKTTVIVLILLIVIYTIFSRLWKDVSERGESFDDWQTRSEAERIARLMSHISFYIRQKDLEPLPLSWMAKDKCPACFGLDMCDKIEGQHVLVEIPKVETPASRKGVFYGILDGMPIVIKRLSHETYPIEFQSFDQVICSNATGSKDCDVSAAIVSKQSFVQQAETFDLSNLIQGWRISYSKEGPLSLPYSLCLTMDVVKAMTELYSADKISFNLSPDQRAILFTSMVVQPESLILQFMKSKQFHKIAPKIHGACGRLIVVEHGGIILENYLNESFADRAELTLQLFGLVNILWHTDPLWFGLYKDFDFENIAVSFDREISLIDYEELTIIQNTLDDKDEHNEYVKDGVCNEECFDKLWHTLSDIQLSVDERQKHCFSLHSVSGAYMYSRLCRNILSDLKEHRDAADVKGRRYRGLLHSIPTEEENKEHEEFINRALKECVHETSNGSRDIAINQLSEILFTFMKHLG